MATSPPEALAGGGAGPEQAPYQVGLFSRTVVHNPICVMTSTFLISVLCAVLGIANMGELAGSFTDLNDPIVQAMFGIKRATTIADESLWDYAVDRRRLASSAVRHPILSGAPAPPFRTTGARAGVLPSTARAPSPRQQGGRRANVDWECSHEQQTWSDSDRLQIIFRFKSGVDETKYYKALQLIRKAQRRVLRTAEFTDYCQRVPGTTDCATRSSPWNVASWPFNQGNVSAARKADVCECTEAFQVDCGAWDEVCASEDGTGLPTCFAEPGELSQSQWLSGASLQTLRSVCVNGSVDTPPTNVGAGCATSLLGARVGAFGINWDCDTLRTKYLRVEMPFGIPTAGYNCIYEGDRDAMEEERQEWELNTLLPKLFSMKADIEESNDDVEVYIWGIDLITWYLNQDLIMLSISFALVFLAIWFQTSSFFITSCGLFEIIISYPIALFIWHLVLGEPYGSYLLYNGLFIILGIGADDIFVMMDAFKQAALEPPHISGTLETRFAYAYNRAAGAMLATSLTTCAAFLSCAMSPIWDIACFGVVNSCMVLADFILVITFFPAAIVVHEKYIKTNPWCQYPRCVPIFRWLGLQKPVAPSKTSEPTPEAQELELAAHLPKDADTETKNEEDPTPGGAEAATSQSAAAPRRLEAFFAGPFADFILEHPRKILVFFACLWAVSLAVAITMLEPATEQMDFFDDDHFFTKSWHISAEKFYGMSNENEYITYTLSYGLNKNRPWKMGNVHPAMVDDEAGEPRYDPSFNLAQHQQGFSDACQAFHSKLAAQGMTFATEYYCWIDDFKRWAERPENFGAFPVPEANFTTAVIHWRDADRFDYGYHNASERYQLLYDGAYQWKTGFVKDGDRISFTYASFNSTVTWDDLERGAVGFQDMWDMYDAAERARKDAQSAGSIPDGLQKMDFYDWMVAGRVFLTAAIENATVSLFIALAVILAMTYNWWLAIISLVTLLCIISEVAFLMVLSGWKINIIESIGISISTGMAIDYLLHLAHSYNEMPGTNTERVRGALANMGISITSGLCTTFFACCALFFTQFLWFRLFGCFITMLIFSSFFTSMFAMTSLLAIAGPNDDQGKLPHGLLKQVESLFFPSRGVGVEQERVKEEDMQSSDHASKDTPEAEGSNGVAVESEYSL